MIRVGIIGAAGYTAGELIRLLVWHPEVEIVWAHSTSNAGQKWYSVHEGLIGDTDRVFDAEYDLTNIDVLFLCSGHGKSTEFWQQNTCPAGLKIIDLAQDYRDEHDGYVYGLPEWQRERIRSARKIANPGCFATAIQLGLLPLAADGSLVGDIALTGITGSTGAGVKPGATTHFSWRSDNLSVYKVFEHQHLLEVNKNLHSFLGQDFAIRFVPMRGDFARGILVAATIHTTLSEDEVRRLYTDFYRTAAFTHVSETAIDLKQVVNTNKALIGIEKHGDELLVTCVIDNLLKGASGQAVQNMNLLFSLPENTGLKLKASAF